MNNNALDFKLAKSVGQYFRLTDSEMYQITEEVIQSVQQWRSWAKEIGIAKKEQELMSAAFNV